MPNAGDSGIAATRLDGVSGSSAPGAAGSGAGSSGPSDAEGMRIALFYAALFLVYGVQVPYLPVWLDWKGLTAAEVAFIAAAPFFVRVVVTPVVSLLADALSIHRSLVIGTTAIALVAAVALSQAVGFWPILLAAVAMLVCASTAMPLAETVAVDAVRRKGLDYGRMRLWGSATFILASYAGGMAVERWGGGVGVWLLIAGAAATVLAALALPRPELSASVAQIPLSEPVEAAVAAGPRPTAVAAARRLVRQPLFLVFLVAAGATQASHAMLYTFGALNWRGQGISSTWIGILWAIGVTVEILLFAWAKPIAARLGLMRLMTIGAAACVVRWLALACDPPLAVLVPLALLHGLTYGATHVAAIKFIARAVPVPAAGTAQGLYATIAAGVGHGAATLASGALYPRYGGASYLAMAALAAVGLAAALHLWRYWSGAQLWDADETAR